LAHIEPVLYSVWIRRGPDIEKYDLVFNETGIELRFLGEYWVSLRPRTGLQRRTDLFIYSLRKRKARQKGVEAIHIDYCDIARYELKRPQQKRKQNKVGTTSVLVEQESARLVLVLRNGKLIEIDISPKVYHIAKSLVKNYLIKGLEKCRKQNKGQ